MNDECCQESIVPHPHLTLTTHVRRSIQLACDRESVQLSVLVLGVGALVGHVLLVVGLSYRAGHDA